MTIRNTKLRESQIKVIKQ